MDVEYITLETNDDFLNQGFVQDIGKKKMLKLVTVCGKQVVSSHRE
jgi:hypothetical protein